MEEAGRELVWCMWVGGQELLWICGVVVGKGVEAWPSWEDAVVPRVRPPPPGAKVSGHVALCVEVSGRRVLECDCQVCVVRHGRASLLKPVLRSHATVVSIGEISRSGLPDRVMMTFLCHFHLEGITLELLLLLVNIGVYC
jgi:hypothetical protein